MKRVICKNCKNVIEYEDKSVWEGNRDFEDIDCPVCGFKLTRIFTDGFPDPRVVKGSDDDWAGLSR